MANLKAEVPMEEVVIRVKVVGPPASGKTQLLARIVEAVGELVGSDTDTLDGINFIDDNTNFNEIYSRLNKVEYTAIDVDPNAVKSFVTVEHFERRGQ